MLKLTVFVVFILAGIVDAGPVVYNKPVLSSSLDQSWNLIPVEHKASSVNLFDDEPNLYGAEEEEAEAKAVPFYNRMYKRIYGWTLKPLMDLTDWMLNPVMSVYTKTKNLIGLGDKSEKTEGGDDDNAPRSRRKRGIAGTVGTVAINTVNLPVSFIYDIALAPFRLIRRIFNFITTPFRAVYNKVGSLMQPSSLRNNSQSLNVVLSLLPNTGSPTTNNEEMWNQMMDNMSKAARRNAVKMLKMGWDYLKTDVLPALDAAFENLGDSEFLPEDFKKMLKNFHRIYQVTHMLKMI